MAIEYRRRLLGASAALAAWLVWTGSAMAAAPPVPVNQTVIDDAFASFIPGPMGVNTERELFEAERRLLDVGALRQPTERRASSVLLRRGVSGAGVESLLTSHGLELMSFEAKVPSNDGRILTHWFTPESWWRTDLSMADQVDRAIGHERYLHMVRAQQLANNPVTQAEAQRLNALARSREFAVYRIDVVGSFTALRSLFDHPLVRLMRTDANDERVEDFVALKKMREANPPIRGLTIRRGVVGPNGEMLPMPGQRPGVPAVPKK